MAAKLEKQKGRPKKTISTKGSAPEVITRKAVKPQANPAKKPTPRKKAIGFEMMKSFQNSIEKKFEEMQKQFDALGEALNEFVYEGKRNNAPICRAQLMDLNRLGKDLRDTIQEAKLKLKPIYKAD